MHCSALKPSFPSQSLLNKSVFSFLRALTTWHCPHLLLHAVLRPRAAATPAVQQSIDISNPPGPQQQTRRTPYRFIDPVPHTVHAGSANNSKIATDLCFRTRYPQISVKIKPRLIKYLCKRYCAFSAFTLLVGRQEEHPACKN